MLFFDYLAISLSQGKDTTVMPDLSYCKLRRCTQRDHVTAHFRWTFLPSGICNSSISHVSFSWMKSAFKHFQTAGCSFIATGALECWWHGDTCLDSVCVHIFTRSAFLIGNDTFWPVQGWSRISWTSVNDMLYSISRKLRYLSKEKTVIADIKPAECIQRLERKTANRWRTRTRWAVSPKSKILQFVIRRPHAGSSQ